MKKSIRARAFAPALSVLSLACGAAFGQALPQEVIVSATRAPQKINETLADVVVITRDEIEKTGQSSITELLATQPGIQSVSYGGNSVFIRGAEARMTAVYIDGVRVDSQEGSVRLGGGVPWEMIPLSNVDRIEVVKGPASAVYGSDPMGGVIQIFTRQYKSGQQVFANAGIGSHQTSKFSTGVSGGQGRFDYALTAAHDETGGFNTVPSVAHNPNREAQRTTAFNGRLGVQLNEMHRLESSFLRNDLNSRYVDMFSPQPTTDFTSVARLDTSTIRWVADWTANYRSKVSLTNSVHDVKDNGWSDFRTTMSGVIYENQWKVNGDNLSANLEHKSDKFEDRSSFGFLGDRTQNALSLGYGGTRGVQSFQVNARHDQDSIFGSKGTAGLAYGYALSDSLKATASISTGFRSPTLEQTYSSYGSRDLKPESSRNRDMGLRYAQGTSKMSLVVYRNDFTNLISARPDFTYYNIGEATVQGATLSASQAVGRYNVRGSYDVLDAQDSKGRDLPLRARHSATAGVDRSVLNWKLGAEVIAVGKRYDNAANTTSLGGYSLVNLYATHQINPDWKLLTRINNAADKQFQQVALMATPGRTLFIGLNWQPKN